MEGQPAPAAPGVVARLSSQLSWYCTLSPPGRAAFWATFSGWALDAYNQMTLGFVLPAVTTAFALSTTQAGLLGTVGGVTSAIGGALADTIGRVQVLLLSIGSYAVFTFLAGCAQSYEQLLVFSTLQGLGLAANGPRARCSWRSTLSRRSAGESSGPSRAHGRSAMPSFSSPIP